MLAPTNAIIAGLIPAHAGKTSIMRRTASLHRAHPRSRGENSESSEEGVSCAGSSPLTRGKPAFCEVV